MRILVLCILLLAASCSEKPEKDTRSNDVDITEVIKRAEDDAKRVHLPELLEDAGTNVRKLGEVYIEAVRLNHEVVQHEADARLSAIVLPRAEAAAWPGTLRKLKRRVPEGSETWRRLDAIHQRMEE
ncbi:MAG: hypothetical protein RL538_609 [Candidatus Parcubacteria bacterium]|jgi:hypothetical protein